MLEEEALKEFLANPTAPKRDKVLACLAAEPYGPRSVAEIKSIAIASGLRAIGKWNVSSYLSAAKQLAIRTPAGWELSAAGKGHIRSTVAPILPSVSILVVSGLRKQLESISGKNTKSFLEETVKCLEAKLYRSAIVTSWVGAVSVLYDVVIELHLDAFNIEATRRDQKWRSAKFADDLTRMKEFEFLQILSALSILGKNVKDELEVCLKLRNGCGHPNSLIVGEHKAAAHVETLIQNVFARY